MLITHRGIKVKYPWNLIGGNLQDKTEKELEQFHEYKNCFNALQQAEYELVKLNPELDRLRAENEFMLRLLNQHMKD